MPAHTVDHDEQGRVLGDCYRDPVLVLLAPAQEADVGVVDPQEDSMHLLDLVALYITPQQTSVAFSYISRQQLWLRQRWLWRHELRGPPAGARGNE
jgi:hypothetical protein